MKRIIDGKDSLNKRITTRLFVLIWKNGWHLFHNSKDISRKDTSVWSIAQLTLGPYRTLCDAYQSTSVNKRRRLKLLITCSSLVFFLPFAFYSLQGVPRFKSTASLAISIWKIEQVLYLNSGLDRLEKVKDSLKFFNFFAVPSLPCACRNSGRYVWEICESSWFPQACVAM